MAKDPKTTKKKSKWADEVEVFVQRVPAGPSVESGAALFVLLKGALRIQLPFKEEADAEGFLPDIEGMPLGLQASDVDRLITRLGWKYPELGDSGSGAASASSNSVRGSGGSTGQKTKGKPNPRDVSGREESNRCASSQGQGQVGAGAGSHKKSRRPPSETRKPVAAPRKPPGRGKRKKTSAGRTGPPSRKNTTRFDDFGAWRPDRSLRDANTIYKDLEAESGGGPVTPSPRYNPEPNWGGTYTDEQAASLIARANSKEAREVADAMRKLIKAIEMGGTKETPRINARKLGIEIVSKRFQLSRIRREEADIPMTVLLVDCSGSCAHVCVATEAACLAVAKELPNTMLLRHSNGYIIHTGRDATTGRLYYGGMLSEWFKHQKKTIGGIISLGDWDAGTDYKWLAEHNYPLIWLDWWALNDEYGDKGTDIDLVRPATSYVKRSAKMWSKQPWMWYEGVRDIAGVVKALGLAQKRFEKLGPLIAPGESD